MKAALTYGEALHGQTAGVSKQETCTHARFIYAMYTIFENDMSLKTSKLKNLSISSSSSRRL